jgi:hypothetical protein
LQEDIFRRLNWMVNILDVGFLGSDEDMMAQKAQVLIAATTFSKVEGHYSLSIGPALGLGQK